ncbi:MAG TPA: hypothetical protein VLI65_05700 [Pyrinomonadaceae bacterium]|nr:hypothetical protein [Pyrinomonadaceae bacterium]
MRLFNLLIIGLLVSTFAASANAQRTEITIGFSEQFFDTLLDAIYLNGGPPEFALSQNISTSASQPAWSGFGEAFGQKNSACTESIKLLRETNGVRTAVRFRDGKIFAPIAFSGNYNPPFIGCVEFGGVAETNVDLEYDQSSQRLVARAKVLNVNLNGSGGVGGNLIAKMVQSSIDRKVNPIEIINLDKVSFALPIQNAPGLKMKAVGISHEISNGTLNVHIVYEFVK